MIQFGAVLFSLALVVSPKETKGPGWEEFGTWFPQQQQRSIIALFKNISPEGTAPGAVIASPQKANPNYFYHWVRDAALVMDVVVEFYKRTRYPESKAKALQLLHNFAAFSRKNQLTPNRSNGPGEPKFHVDGSAYDEDWGRPQNDGPALRAVTLIKYAQIMLSLGREQYVRENLYDPHNPTVIKEDLDFTAARWRDPCVDLWEEVGGIHFYTRMSQRRAMLDGARFAELMKDSESAARYKAQAQLISEEMNKFWDPNRGRILTTLNQYSGIYKPANLDTAVILGVLHAETGDGFFGPSDERVLSSAYQMKYAFKKLYTVNQRSGLPGVGLGRYPEDTYSGNPMTAGRALQMMSEPPREGTKSQGNPWFLTTLALAEIYYRAEEEIRNRGRLTITRYNYAFFQDLLPDEPMDVGTLYERGNEIFSTLLLRMRTAGDAQLLRTAQHMNQATGSMAEQFNRDHGYMQSAADLTWSYAAFLTAAWARPDFERQRILRALK